MSGSWVERSGAVTGVESAAAGIVGALVGLIFLTLVAARVPEMVQRVYASWFLPVFLALLTAVVGWPFLFRDSVEGVMSKYEVALAVEAGVLLVVVVAKWRIDWWLYTPPAGTSLSGKVAIVTG